MGVYIMFNNLLLSYTRGTLLESPESLVWLQKLKLNIC